MIIPMTSDLSVQSLSSALSNFKIDVIVSGSIAAVESVKFIRALRRLGSVTQPWLTQGGSQFITPVALEWAANHSCIQHFSGTASHICLSDAVVVAPASSNIINQVATGSTNTPATALIASALGQGKPVLILPAMHDSLAQAPAYIQNLKTLASWKNVFILTARLEESKRKFPDPRVLADQVAHTVNKAGRPHQPVMLTMGTTRGYIDDVRYLSNYSSGKLGSEIADELYRLGFQTSVICGPSEFRPANETSMVNIRTTSELLAACQQESAKGISAAIFCASVLDYEPNEKIAGKIKSNAANLNIELKPTPKVIGKIELAGKPKIGFKLEVNLTLNTAKEIAQDYCEKYKLTALIINDLAKVSASGHHAWAIESDGRVTECASKKEIAQWVGKHLSK